jgi:hypothetical protein
MVNVNNKYRCNNKCINALRDIQNRIDVYCKHD